SISLFVYDYIRTFSSGNRTANYEQVLLRINFQHLQVLNLYTVAPCSASHTCSFKHARRPRRGPQRTGSTQAVVLSVSCPTNTTKPVAFHNALETFSF